MIALLYHDVVSCGQYSTSGFSGRDADRYKLEVEEFAKHLDSIDLAAGTRGVGVIGGKPGLTSSEQVLLTFDDGGVGAMIAADLLEQHGWRGHFFITTDYIGRREFLSGAHIRDLHSRGHMIGSHSCSHPARMSHCSPAQLKHEWDESASILADLSGVPTRAASVPGGYFAIQVAEAASEAGITVLFNSEPTKRVSQVRDCMVVGRFSIQQGVSAETAASIAADDWRPQMRQVVYWNAKKLVKQAAGNYYISLRKNLLNRGSGKAV